MGRTAISEHGPDLARATASRLEDDVTAIGSPTRTLIAAGIAGELAELVRDNVHNVDIVIAGRTAPGKGEKLTVGRPCRVNDVAHVGQIDFARIGAIGIHEIELGNATAIANESDELAGFGIPSGGSVGTVGGEGDTLGAVATGVGDIKSGIALHGGREHHLRAVGRPCGRVIGAAIASEGDKLVRIKRIHADLRANHAADRNKAGEGDAGGIGRPARSERDGMKRGKRMLVGAIVIHDPEFLGADIAANESDLRGSNAGKATRKFADNFVGELVSEFADLDVGGNAAIDLADDGLARRAADVVHPSEDGDFGGSFGEIAEGEEISVHGRLGPIEHLEFTGLGRSFGRIKIWAGKIENAGEGEIFANDVGEENGVRFVGIGFWSEVGDGDARPFDAEAGAGAEPVLRKGGGGNKKESEEAKKNGKSGFS